MVESGPFQFIPRYYYRIVSIAGILMMSLLLVYHKHSSLSFLPAVSDQASMEVRYFTQPENASSKKNTDASPLPDLVELNLDDTSIPLSKPTNESVRQMFNFTKYADPVKDKLLSGLIPNIVHIVWCDERWFEFKHYLTIQTIIKSLDPDRMVFHYEYYPVMDELYYFQWLDTIKHDFPWLYMEQLQGEFLDICHGDTMEIKIERIIQILSAEGGVYVGESTWLLNFPKKKLLVDYEFALETASLEGYIILRSEFLNENSTLKSLLSEKSDKVKESSCATIGQLFNGGRSECVIVKDGKYDHFKPMHIWSDEGPFGRLVRKIFYGTEEIVVPEPSYDELVPNIGHMIWVGGYDINFVFYLSALSMLYVMDVDYLYIHGNEEPTNLYWKQLMAYDRIIFVRRPEPLYIYQGEVDKYYKALMSDIIRLDIMIKYGGIYGDTDAIWVKPLSYAERGYDACGSFDWVDWAQPFPDQLNLGVSYGKKNAPFWRIFRETFRVLHNDLHGFSGVMMPYKLLERYPHLVRVDNHLSVICFKLKCHPTWYDDYHREDRHHLNINVIPNWKEDVHAFHWTHPNPPEYKNLSALMESEGLFADIGKFVLEKAGIIVDLNGTYVIKDKGGN